MTKLNVIKKFNRTRLMRVALVLLMACFTNDMFGQQLYVAIQSFNMRTRTVNEFPEDEQTMGKYFSLDGQFITSYEYPLKNLPLRYQYGYTDGDRSYYYMVSTDIITGRAYYNKNNYVAVSTEGYIDTVTGDIGFTYLPIDESTLISRRQNAGGGSSSGGGGGFYYDEGSSSGSYSSGSSSSGSTYQSTPQRCPACRGTGTCSNCHGTGWYQVSHTSNKQARCGCGNGRCRSCHGTGHR